MTVMFINIITGFHHDQAIQRADGRQYRSNLSAVVDVIVLRISLDATSGYRQPPPSTPSTISRLSRTDDSPVGFQPGMPVGRRPDTC
jgi:hypothetical protein